MTLLIIIVLISIMMKNLGNSILSENKQADSLTLQQGLLEVKCIMNRGALVDEATSFKVYQCNYCDNHPDNICEDCYENCHGKHMLEKKKEKTVFLKNVNCQCAENNHVVGNFKKVVLDKKETEFMLGMAMGLSIKKETSHDSVSSSSVKGSPLHAFKKPEFEYYPESHCKILEYIGRQFSYFSKTGNRFELLCISCIKFCNQEINIDGYVQVPLTANYYSCTCQAVCHADSEDRMISLERLLLEETILGVPILSSQLSSNIINIKQQNFKCFEAIKDLHQKIFQNISSSADNTLTLSEVISPMYKIGINILNRFRNIYTRDSYALSETEPSQDANLGEFGLLQSCFSLKFLSILFSAKESEKNECVLYIKHNSLLQFRQMILKPKLRNMLLTEFGNNENISPLHRIIFRKEMGDIIDKDMYFQILGSIPDQITKYITQKMPMKDVAAFIVEYLKHLKIIHLFSEFSHMLQSHVDTIHEIILSFGSMYQENDDKLQETIEELTFHFFMRMNDTKVLDKLLSDEKTEEKEKAKSKLQYCFEKDSTSANPNNDKEAQGYTQQKLFIALTNLPGPEQISPDRKNSYIKNEQIYDMLINGYDYYSETMKSLLESKGMIFNKSMIKDLISQKNLAIDGLELMDMINKDKDAFYYGMIDNKKFLTILWRKLKDIKWRIFIEFKQDKQKKFNLQIYLVRVGVINQLSKIYYLIGTYEFLKELAIGIQHQILEIFAMLGEENSFASAIFFNQLLLDTIILYNAECDSIKTLTFYKKLLKGLKKDWYRLDFSHFLKLHLDKFRSYDMNKRKNNEIYCDELEHYEHYHRTLFSIVIKCLQLSTDKTKEHSHGIIAKHIKEYLENPDFLEIIQELIEKKYPITKDIWIFFTVLKAVNVLSNYSFPLLWPSFPKTDLEKIIYTREDLKMGQRKIINRTLSRIYLDNWYPVEVSYRVNANRIKEMRKEVWGLMKYIDKNKIVDSDVSDLRLEEVFKISPDDETEFKAFGLRHVLFTLGKYKSHIKSEEFDQTEKSFKLVVKYFNESIYHQAVEALYLLTYYPPSFSLKLKYLMYTIVHLFLKSFACFLEWCEKNVKKKVQLAEILNNYINIDSFNNINRTTGGIRNNITRCLNQLSNLALLEPFVIFSIWDAIAVSWKPFRKSQKENYTYYGEYRIEFDLETKKDHPNFEFYFSLFRCYQNYIESKLDYKESMLTEFFRNEQNHQTLIAVDVLSQLKLYDSTNEKNSTLAPFPDSNSLWMERIIKLFIIHPELFQKIFTTYLKHTKPVLFSIIRDQLLFHFQYIFVEFTRRNSREKYAYDNFLFSIEFLRLLCENHNLFFQTVYMKITDMNDNTIEFNSFLYNISLCITNHLSHWINKKKIAEFLGRYPLDMYFNPLIMFMFNFYIENIQGTLTSNFKNLFINNEFQMFYQSIEEEVLSVDYANYMNREKDYYLLHVMRFVNALVEDGNNTQKNDIYSNVNIKKLYQVCQCFYKKMVYYMKHETRITTKEDTEALESLVIEEGDSSKLLKCYGLDENYDTDIYFSIACELYYYLYRLARVEVSETEINQNLLDNICEAKEILTRLDTRHKYEKSLRNKNDQKKEESIDPKQILESELYTFFKKLIKTIELSYNEDENAEFMEYNYDSLFDNETNEDGMTLAPMIQPYEGEDLHPEGKENSDLIVEQILNERLSHTISSKKPFLVHFKIHPDGIFIKRKSVQRFKENAITQGGEGIDHMIRHLKDPQDGIQRSIDIRKKLWTENSRLLFYLYNLPYELHVQVSLLMCLAVNILMLFTVADSPTIQAYVGFYISLANFIYMILIILSYLRLKTFLTNRFSLVYLIDYRIFPLTWSLIACSLGLFTPLFFFYSIQLCALFFVVKTMFVVLKAIQLRYEQFLSAALVIIITVLIFSLISFFFFKNEFYNEELQENKCGSVIQCFVFALNSGLRSQGVGLPMYSYNTDTMKYWIEFMFDMIFYICLIFIMLNVINGIVVDTFQALREDNNKKDTLKKDVCFICTLTRSQFEIKGKDFDKHVNKEHDVTSYFQYLVKVKKENQYDLNAMDTHVYECIDTEKTDFFPYQAAHYY